MHLPYSRCWAFELSPPQIESNSNIKSIFTINHFILKKNASDTFLSVINFRFIPLRAPDFGLNTENIVLNQREFSSLVFFPKFHRISLKMVIPFLSSLPAWCARISNNRTPFWRNLMPLKMREEKCWQNK